jgi:cell division protein FtsX
VARLKPEPWNRPRSGECPVSPDSGRRSEVLDPRVGLFRSGSSKEPPVPRRHRQSGFREQAEAPFRILLATASLVHFIGCLNIANLLLTRATKRRKEIAVRLSLGGTRWRLVRELIVEGSVLAGLGLIAGLGVAVLGGKLLVDTLPDPNARELLSFALDARILAFAGLLAFLGVVISTVIPALQGTRVALTPSLREGSGATAAGGRRTRNALVVGQLALSLALLVGAGLLARSLFNLASRPVGYNTENVASFSLNPSLAGYDEAQKRSLFERVREQIEAQPDVASVGMSDNTLLANSNSSSTIKLPGYTPTDEEDMNPLWLRVNPAFTTSSRRFWPAVASTNATESAPPKVAIVNEAFANTTSRERARSADGSVVRTRSIPTRSSAWCGTSVKRR